MAFWVREDMPLVRKRRRRVGRGEERRRGARARVRRWVPVVFVSKVWWKAWREVRRVERTDRSR